MISLQRSRLVRDQDMTGIRESDGIARPGFATQ